jgi:hypothetical protein
MAKGVKARLDGHQFDLQALTELFREGDPTVAKDADNFYLTSEELDGLWSDPTELLSTAQSLLLRVNGTARILHGGSYRPVELRGHFTDEMGKTQVFLQPHSAEIRMSAGTVVLSTNGEQPATPRPQGPQYLSKIADNRAVAEVLEILGKPVPALDWFDLYKVFEIIRHAVGDEGAIKANEWASSTEINKFRESANRREISGSDARHARLPGSPSGRSMSINEGREFIRRLAKAWLDSL